MILRELFESTVSDVAIIFGRFNPPHFGHVDAWQVAAGFPDWYVGTNQSTQGPKDPLPYDIKIEAMKKLYPKLNGHLVPEQSWFTLAVMVYKKYGSVTLHIVTDDKDVNVYLPMLQKQNGIEGPHGYYKFKDIVWAKAMRQSEASLVRKAVKDNNPKDFEKYSGVSPNTIVAGHPYFDLVRHYILPYMQAEEEKERSAAEKARLKSEKEAAKKQKVVKESGDTVSPVGGKKGTGPAHGGYDIDAMRQATGTMEEGMLDEVAAFHGSFRPRIGKFKFFSHFGSEQAAKERLDYLTAEDPRFKGITTGYLYKLDLGINNPATVKDHVDQQDPSTGNMIKIASWINDLKNDPRVKSYKYQKDERTLAWFANNATRGYWREWMSPEAFIGEFINLLEKMGIDGFVYKNAVEHKGELSYISFRPENVKIVGRAKPVPLTPPEGVERKEKFTKPSLRFPTEKPKPGEQIYYIMDRGNIEYEISAKDIEGVKAEIKEMRSWGLDFPRGYKIVLAPVDPNATAPAAPAKKKVKEGVIDEVADQPYRYMLTKKLPDARQYMFQTDSGTKFQVFFSLLDSGTEKIADVGFADQTDKDNPTIGVTGKGDAFRVFSTVGAIVKEYVNSVKPEFLSFNGKTQDPGRIKLYDMIAKNIGRYLKDYEQSSHTMPGATDEKGYMLQRITHDVEEVSKVSLSSDPDNFGAWVRDGGTPEKTVVIPTRKIHVFEPDSKFDDPHHAKNLANIVKAIKAGKKLPPILVRRHGIDRFQVVDGHHRFMAYRMAGAKSIPVRVVDPKNVKEV